MKVLIVSNIPFPYIVDSFNELGKQCDLTVLFLRKQSRDRDSSWISDNINHFKAIYLKGVEFGSENVLAFSVLKHLKSASYDIIYFDCYSRATSVLGILYLKLTGKPFVIGADGGYIKQDESFIVNKVKTFLIGGASYWLSSGYFTDEYLLHYGAKKDKIYHFPLTTLTSSDIIKSPLSKIEKDEIKAELGIKYKNVVISVGRFIPLKRFDVLISSAQYLDSNTAVIIIGGTPTSEYLELIKKLNLTNVFFIDFISKERLKLYYKCADVFVFPTSNDVWGFVVNEAMSCGLPVISTDKSIAGLELVKNNENGFIIPVGNIEVTAARINEIISNEQLVNAMAINNIQKIQGYTIEKMADKQASIFRKIKNKLI